MRKWMMVAALFVLVPAGDVLAQKPDMGRAHGHAGMRARNPIAFILEHRRELSLSADQVARLERIQSELQSRNAPLIARLEAVHGDMPMRRDSARARREMTQEQRERMRDEMRSRMEEVRPIHEELRESFARAVDDVDDVLNDDQEKKLRELRRAQIRERRGDMHKRREEMR